MSIVVASLTFLVALTMHTIFGETQSKVTIIPFYGGGKGQSLQITENPDGTVTTAIISTPVEISTEEVINAAELENPPLPSKHDYDYGQNLRDIHKIALNILKLQANAKRNGKLSPTEETEYKENMTVLNAAAMNLARTQESPDEYDFENREGLGPWFERKKSTKKDKDRKKEEEKKRKEEEEKKKQEEEEKKRKEEEEKRKNEKEEEEEIVENEDDGVAINLPSDSASVAEAKPVGLAVAGEGGVAASKPIATAVVGPGGLAIARPVGTAIAGVSPDQALVPIYAEGYLGASKPKRYGSGSSSKPDAASEYLNKIIHKYHNN